MVVPHHYRQGPPVDVHARWWKQKVAVLGIPRTLRITARDSDASRVILWRSRAIPGAAAAVVDTYFACTSVCQPPFTRPCTPH